MCIETYSFSQFASCRLCLYMGTSTIIPRIGRLPPKVCGSPSLPFPALQLSSSLAYATAKHNSRAACSEVSTFGLISSCRFLWPYSSMLTDLTLPQASFPAVFCGTVPSRRPDYQSYLPRPQTSSISRHYQPPLLNVTSSQLLPSLSQTINDHSARTAIDILRSRNSTQEILLKDFG